MKLNALNRLGFIGQHTKLGDVIAKLVNRDADVLEAIDSVRKTYPQIKLEEGAELDDFIEAIAARTNSLTKTINDVIRVFETITLYKDANGNITGGKVTYKGDNYEIKVVDAPQ